MQLYPIKGIPDKIRFVMSNSGPPSTRNLAYSGKHVFLPPKSPFPGLSPSYVDYIPNPPIGSRAVQRPGEGYSHHQRTSSESFLMEDQPSWLDDLLDEPETPVRRGGHRRSSSDSIVYIDVANFSDLDYAAHDERKYRNEFSVPYWGSQEMDRQRGGQHAYFVAEKKNAKQKNRVWESSRNVASPPGGPPLAGDDVATQNSAPIFVSQEVEKDSSMVNGKQDQVESIIDLKASSERKDASRAKPSSIETDSKRAKQQFAQRSRVRKLQYIAELERNVQALQVEGSEVSAEIEFLNQQHLILNMENNTLKQRLESLAQERLIKYFEHEVLEREIGRLRTMCQQQQNQQQQQQPSSGHQRSSSGSSKSLDAQFANLSLKPKDATSRRDTMSGPLHT